MDASNKCKYCDISSGSFIKHYKSNQSDNFYLFIAYSFLWMDDIDIEQSSDGFDWIYRKVTFKVRQARFYQFFHNYKYNAVVMKCCPNVYNHVDALVKTNPVLKKGLIWIFVIYLANISETVHAMTNVGMTHIYKVVYKVVYIIVQFTFISLTLDEL